MSDALEGPAYLVMPPEAEQLIEQLKNMPLEAIGASKDWIAYHHIIEKLNLQAHQSAARKQDNFVVESLLTYQKMPPLIVNLLATEMWKAQIFPQLKCQDKEAASLRLYFILYHEAALVNLFEVAFYHEHVVETLDDDLLLEMVDYCMRKITWLISLPRDAIATNTAFHKTGEEAIQMIQTQNSREELARQQMETEFRVAVQSVTILRYTAERLHVLPLSVVSRLLDKHDALLSLVVLVENPPWTHKELVKDEKTNETQVRWKKFAQQKWSYVEPSDLLVLTATEAQVWLAIYYLVCTKSAREHYEVTQYRKDQLLRIRKYLNELMLDQLPLLSDVQRYLDELAIVQVPPSAIGVKSSLVMEVVPHVRENMMRRTRNELAGLAKRFDELSREFKRGEDLLQLAEVYQMDGIEELLDATNQTTLDDQNAGSKVEEEEEDEDDEVEPSVVTLIFHNHRVIDAKPDKKPLIVEILDDDDNNNEQQTDLVLPELVSVVCDVDLASCKAVEAKSGRYYRYALRPRPRETKEPILVSWNASAEATITFESELSDPTNISVQCDELTLPQIRGGGAFKHDKLWMQIGSLQEGPHRLVVQCQFITTPEVLQGHDNQLEAHIDDLEAPLLPFTLGALFLSLPF
ncbi:hypothetical protein Poli38472_004346 [Pythium oligandrum]|uniref:Uncharacterized protein n=1 Tax=Pythium oligandrum TaxID=41045 RepID=A0A8K1CBC4_PYTOL|nr:hypothetical protein Poli38472_004346 [Pythium oligandrum]|eukprot:TMW59277.1 hypothetical protein Poli38472_004346 [Pythium oligandrum]